MEKRVLQIIDNGTFAQEEATRLYLAGNEKRRRGDWQGAINHYIEASELDPNSPAVEAKKMLSDILDYYNKDIYNP